MQNGLYSPLQSGICEATAARATPTGSRARAYWEADDFEQGARWLPDEPVPWVRTDQLDGYVWESVCGFLRDPERVV